MKAGLSVVIALSCCPVLQGQVFEFDQESIQKDFVYNLQVYGRAYTDPVLDVIGYNLICGWDETGKTLPWGGVRFSLITAATFVPQKDVLFDFNKQPFSESVRLSDNSKDPMLPTALGGPTNKSLIYQVKDNNGNTYEQEMEAFEGISVPWNAVPNFVPQISVGLPLGFEFNGRFLYMKYVGTQHLEYGFGMRYDITHSVRKDGLFNWAAGVFYDRSVNSYLPQALLDGSDQKISLVSGALLGETTLSLDWKYGLLYTSLGYFRSTTDFDIRGTYSYTARATFGGQEFAREAFKIKDPVSIINMQKGFRLAMGCAVKIYQRFGMGAAFNFSKRTSLAINLSYHFGKLKGD